MTRRETFRLLGAVPLLGMPLGGLLKAKPTTVALQWNWDRSAGGPIGHLKSLSPVVMTMTMMLWWARKIAWSHMWLETCAPARSLCRATEGCTRARGTCCEWTGKIRPQRTDNL